MGRVLDLGAAIEVAIALEVERLKQTSGSRDPIVPDEAFKKQIVGSAMRSTRGREDPKFILRLVEMEIAGKLY